MKPRVRCIGFALAGAFVGALALAPRVAGADAVDEAFARGHQAAEREDWDAAIEAYREVESLSPERSALLSYDLGTAYAQAGDLGRATYHLLRALQFEAGPTAEVAEAARFNLDIVRRRAELQATASGARIDQPQTWWDIVVEAVAAPGVAWMSLVSGWAFVAAWLLHRRRKASRLRGGVAGALAIVFAVCWAVPGLFHAAAISVDRTAPEAVILGAKADAREGPGNHRGVVHTLQGGARVRIVDHTPGWRRVRLQGGIEGWVPEDSVARLDVASASARHRPPGTPAS